MKKKLLCVALVATMIMGSSLTVFAEDLKGESGWEVIFNGKDLESNFSSANIDDAIYSIQPGDTMEIAVTVRNGSDIDTDWYMTNKVLKTLEEADAKSQDLPTGGAYGYLLTYTDPSGEVTTLYRSEMLGGDDAEGEVGLLAATDSLDEYFFLDRLAVNQSGVVTLKVSLEGETQGNDYQNTLARVQMNFAVERVSVFDIPDTSDDTPPPTPGNDDPDTPGQNQEIITETIIVENQIQEGDTSTIGFSSPKTDDSANFLYPVIALVAGLVLFVAGMIKSRRDSETEENNGRRE